jgi:hypothetical protein
MQPPLCEPDLDRASRPSKPEQLTSRDHAMLLPRKLPKEDGQRLNRFTCHDM